jgi:DAACS family dicarboxylate/amino acid:cation (Na+ or H+) symporter/proton glutamate symport protein
MRCDSLQARAFTSGRKALLDVAETNKWVVDFFPSNIFAALSSNQITSVLVFIIIFGIGVAAVERRTGSSLFSELTHLHDVCLLIFEWLNLFVPFGIIALIAPQIARLGSGVLLFLLSSWLCLQLRA